VKNAVPLLDFINAFVDLRPVASGAVGCCPFHDDKHPSFGVNREGNFWQCFAGCGAGSIIDFWMKWKGIEFHQAVTELADLLRVEDKT
jgi:DNA primase